MPAQSPSPGTENNNLRFIIIGAGMAGILSAVRLKEAGLNNFTIYEKAERLGGTWRENTYAGVTCDVPSHLYSYSFALNPNWSHRFAPGSEILSYFESVAKDHGVAERIHFGCEITRCEWVDGRWRVSADDGTHDEADFVIAATGVLHHPAYPDFPGIESFKGAAFHSARWDADVPMTGKRVGVVGTGSSAIQIIGALADRVAKLSVFQRTAQWVMPVDNPRYSDGEREEFRKRPEAMQAIREEVSRAFIDGFANVLGDATSPVLEAIHAACVDNLETSVVDPELREKLRPDYRAGCKRLVLSGTFYDAIQHPNTNLVTEAIERVEENGVRTSDGNLHQLDVLVMATGFRVDQFMRPMQVFGRNGVALNDEWRRSPSAYMAVSIPDFPNLFMLNGPNGPVGNFSLIDVAELQFGYIMQLVDQVRSGKCREIVVSREAARRFDDDRKEAAQSTIWNTGCRSWYLDHDGLPTAWPWTFDRFREEMSSPKLIDYEIR